MNRGRLKNGNQAVDLTTLPRCGAKTRRGSACQRIARKVSGRCRLHGGVSTGPKTHEGLNRSKTANWKHGFYSQEAIRERQQFKEFLRETKKLINQIS